MRTTSLAVSVTLAITLFAITGCGGDSETQSSDNADSPDNGQVAESPNAKKKSFKPLDLGDPTGGPGAKPVAQLSPAEKTEAVRKALDPLQIMTGTWEGTTRKSYGGFKGVDTLSWRWDFNTDKSQPALVYVSDKNDYVRTARITFLIDKQKYHLTTTNSEGDQRIYEGDFSEPVREEPGDDKKLHRSYKLQFRQVADAGAKDVWEVVFNQQNNNRYLLDFKKRRPSSGKFDVDIDTVGTQRQGVSFALSASDYGDKTCIVSQGLGTSTVMYKGKTYYVCCSGCRGAFEEEPERWIAAAEKRKMKK
jgi:hypothetical protein